MDTTVDTTIDNPIVVPAESAHRQAKATQLVNRHSLAAGALGLLPLPFIDLALIAAAQLNMLRRLAGLYGVPFSEQLGKSAIATLIAGSLPVSSFSLLKLIPGIGTVLGSVSFPAVAGAATYGIGKVFIQHFESGGTFLNFDPVQVRTYYQQQFAQRRAAAPTYSAGAVADDADDAAAAGPDKTATATDVTSSIEPAANVAAVIPSSVPEAPPIVITSIRFLGQVKGSQSDEFVELRNASVLPMDVSGWRLRSEGPGHGFVFPASTVIGPGTTVRIYTDLPSPPPGRFSFDSKRAIWNDKGDQATLSDATGRIIAKHGYGDHETRTLASITAAFGVPGLKVVYDPEQLATQKKYRGKVDFLTAVEDALRSLLEEPGDEGAALAAATSRRSTWTTAPRDFSQRPLPERLRAYLDLQKLVLVHHEPLPEGLDSVQDHWIFRLAPGLGDQHLIIVSRAATQPTHQKIS